MGNNLWRIFRRFCFYATNCNFLKSFKLNFYLIKSGTQTTFTLNNLASIVTAHPNFLVMQTSASAGNCTSALWYVYGGILYMPKTLLSNYISLYKNLAGGSSPPTTTTTNNLVYNSQTNNIQRFCWTGYVRNNLN